MRSLANAIEALPVVVTLVTLVFAFLGRLAGNSSVAVSLLLFGAVRHVIVTVAVRTTPGTVLVGDTRLGAQRASTRAT